MPSLCAKEECCLVCGTPLWLDKTGYALFKPKGRLLCGNCQRQLVPSRHRHVLHEYNDFFRSLLFSYKAIGDLALAPVFLDGYQDVLKRKYRHYTIVFAPSYKKDDEQRGFMTLPWIFKSLNLPMLQVFYKKVPYKQAISKHRETIYHIIALRGTPDIRHKKILLVDDVTTSGHTLEACRRLLLPYHPQKIEILVLAKKTKKKKRGLSDMKGKVKKFIAEKGYGFIEAENEEQDIFFHYSQIVGQGYKTVCEGQPVKFSLDENERGKYAKHIVKL